MCREGLAFDNQFTWLIHPSLTANVMFLTREESYSLMRWQTSLHRKSQLNASMDGDVDRYSNVKTLIYIVYLFIYLFCTLVA